MVDHEPEKELYFLILETKKMDIIHWSLSCISLDVFNYFSCAYTIKDMQW